ncbi:two-component sensor histidine kinase [Solihabitans fulvus]|uniref:histidine kinase n=1 Tax=Solihabitans fulvus TaxID=1892852 RepID=A0A5B2XCG1_9PSEU|nr:histidine kinase [Solihabitans fulvus]KAA2261438.1 two-component sensor histidine kinase [Solihabitans fulvus]
MLDISGSLARQALLVAAVCLVADLGMLFLRVPMWHWQTWVVAAALALTDVGLAARTSLSGVVAVAHAVLRVAGPLLLASVCTVGEIGMAGLLISAYRAGAWLRTAPAVVALVALLVGVLGNDLLDDKGRESDWRLLAISGLVNGLLPWLVGRHTTARGAHIAELEQRAERQRRDEQAAVRRAVAEERGAIARDLHDVISHHVSAIGVHAGAARLSLATVPAGPPHASLTAVETSSRSAMTDLRRLLGVLHGDAEEGVRRQPGLDNVDDLLDGVRAAGLAVTMSIAGPRRELPPSLDVALYRIVQEALTNALRHGGGAAEVSLTYQPDRLRLTVANTLPTPAPRGVARERGPRRGMAGMRKRVGLFGGDLSYGPDPDGSRWVVEAAFPLPGNDDRPTGTEGTP